MILIDEIIKPRFYNGEDMAPMYEAGPHSDLEICGDGLNHVFPGIDILSGADVRLRVAVGRSHDWKPMEFVAYYPNDTTMEGLAFYVQEALPNNRLYDYEMEPLLYTAALGLSEAIPSKHWKPVKVCDGSTTGRYRACRIYVDAE